jgi:hypothetical protein
MKERVSATKVYFVFTYPFLFLIYFIFCVTLVVLMILFVAQY